MAAPFLRPTAGEELSLTAEQLKEFTSQLNPSATVETLAGLGSRIPGYEGHERAVEFITRKLERFGLTPEIETFDLAIPVDKGALLRLASHSDPVQLRCIWPNFARTSRLPAVGITGPLLYVRSGSLSEFNQKPVQGSVVLIDFNCATRWLNASMLGAQAVIFVEPEVTAFRAEATQKFLLVPAPLPRFWISRKDAGALAQKALGWQQATNQAGESAMEALALAGKKGSFARAPEVTLNANIAWENVQAKNIVATLPGTDPVLSRQTIILEAYYDSISVVPTLAPGADAACGIAAMLEMARIFSKHPPKRTVKFLATSAHFQGLAGIRNWAARHVYLQREKGSTAVEYFLENREQIEESEVGQLQIATISMKDLKEPGFWKKIWLFVTFNWWSNDTENFITRFRAEVEELKLEESFKNDFMTLESLEKEVKKSKSEKNFELLKEKSAEIAELYLEQIALLKSRVGKGKIRQMADTAKKLKDLKRPGWWTRSQLWAKRKWYSQETKDFLIEFRHLIGDLDLESSLVDEKDTLYDIEKELKLAEGAKDFEKLKELSEQLGVLFLKIESRFVAEARKEEPEPLPTLFIGLDLSSRGKQMGVFYKGHFFDQFGPANEFRLQRVMAPIGDKVLAVAAAAKELDEDLTSELVSGVVPKRGRDWRSYMPDQIALDGESLLLGGVGSLSFVTTNDTRALIDTPNDDLENFDPENLLSQTRLLFPLLYEVFNSPNIPLQFKLENHFSDVYLQVIEDQLIDYLPQTPISGALTSITLAQQKSMMGVRGQMFKFSRHDGTFEVFGVSKERGKSYQCWAFMIDPKDGSIERITNLANSKGRPYSVRGRQRSWKERVLHMRGLSRVEERNSDQRLPLYSCSSITVFDLMDQLYFTSFQAFKILDARSNTEPKYYATFMGRSRFASYSEPVAVAFAEPDSNVKLICSTGSLGLGAKFTLLNTTDDDLRDIKNIKDVRYPEGRGFLLREREQLVHFSPYRAAKDMWLLDESRLEKLRVTGIRNKQVSDLHFSSKERLQMAEEARDKGLYDAFLNNAREAWGLEARAYPSVQSTANDVIKGVIFYFAILLPFAYFTERLFFAFADIRKQLVGVAFFFMIIYIILHFVHPAFRISKTPIIILDGFFTLAIGVVVTLIVLNKFNVQMAKLREKTSAIHGADVARGSAIMAAFTLGISNMRRRKVRTALTCITLILLTFTVMSFTSFDTGLKFNKVDTTYDVPYQGILLRRRDWGAIEEHAYYSITDYFRSYPEAKIAVRTWKTAPKVGETLSLQVLNAEDPEKSYSAQALVGLTSTEAEITYPDKQLVAGRWFTEEENKGEFVCILPKRMAEFLGISQDDFEPGKYAVNVTGDEYKVVGIIDGGGFYESRDLDNEPLTPVDFIEMQQRQGAEEQGGDDETDAQAEEALPELYIHMEGDNVIIIPATLSIQLGASLQSIAVKMEKRSPEQLDKLLEDYVRRLKLILFAGFNKTDKESEKVLLYSSRGSLSVAGLKGLFVPVLIAALIVFNTMLGSVYERTREIGIYAAVGLAPIHISALFLAESFVYATVGAIVGYLVGQIVAKIIVTFNIWKELSLNYSSTAAVVTTLIVVATVLLSTLFPAMKAAELSVPDETRKLKLPPPQGDYWVFDFPFTVGKTEAIALNMYLFDYFKAHDEDSIGRFCADQVELVGSEEDGKPVFNMTSLVWIAPLDMGISQRVRIETREADDDEMVDVLRFHIDRESGEVDTWRRMNTGFFKDLRKQLLIWRLVEQNHKRELIIRGHQHIGLEPPQAVVEAYEAALEAERQVEEASDADEEEMAEVGADGEDAGAELGSRDA